MSDNVTTPIPSGTKVAADEVVHPTLGTVKVQYVKLMSGTIDSPQEIGHEGDAIKAHLATALSQSTDSILAYQPILKSTRLTASGLVLNGAGRAIDIVVSSVTGTASIKLWDNSTAGSGTPIVETITPLVAGQTIQLNGREAVNGIWATISGTCSVSVGYHLAAT